MEGYVLLRFKGLSAGRDWDRWDGKSIHLTVLGVYALSSPYRMASLWGPLIESPCYWPLLWLWSHPLRKSTWFFLWLLPLPHSVAYYWWRSSYKIEMPMALIITHAFTLFMLLIYNALNKVCHFTRVSLSLSNVTQFNLLSIFWYKNIFSNTN